VGVLGEAVDDRWLLLVPETDIGLRAGHGPVRVQSTLPDGTIDQIAVDHGAEVTRQRPGGDGGALGQFEVINPVKKLIQLEFTL